MSGALYLIPTPLDFGCKEQVSLHHVLPTEAITQASQIDYWVCENAKSLRRFLGRVREIAPLHTPIQEQHIVELSRAAHKRGDHNAQASSAPREWLQPALDGHAVGLVCEAGIPAVADPGSSVVRLAHELGIAVHPYSGPSSLIMALAASGLNGQNFAFVGYLPAKAAERTARIKVLEKTVTQQHQAQLFIETPYRNTALLDALLNTLSPQIRLSISAGISLPNALHRSGTVAQWRDAQWGDSDIVAQALKLPCVFAMG